MARESSILPERSSGSSPELAVRLTALGKREAKPLQSPSGTMAHSRRLRYGASSDFVNIETVKQKSNSQYNSTLSFARIMSYQNIKLQPRSRHQPDRSHYHQLELPNCVHPERYPEHQY